MTRYTVNLIDIQITELLESAVRSFETNFGTIRSYAVRKVLLQNIKEDLLRILADAVDISLDYFYQGKRRGDMDKYLRKGIKVKGQTLASLRAILSGIDYTVVHEENTKFKPTKSRFIAIPLPDACRSDGTPKLSSPEKWNATEKTWLISGTEALNTYNRTPASTQINPHSPGEVKYIVYKDKSTGNLVYLYKLVPYSYFFEGYTNYKGKPLKKLGLRGRIEAGIRSAINGWYNLVWNTLSSIPDFSNLRAYNDIHIYETIEQYKSTYNRSAIPKGRISGSLVSNIENFAFISSKILTI